jgi:hypothetical protein
MSDAIISHFIVPILLIYHLTPSLRLRLKHLLLTLQIRLELLRLRRNLEPNA